MRERFAGIRRAFRVGAVERDIDEEIAFHLERTVEELVAAGVPPGQARAEAERRFGSTHHYRRALTRLDRGAEARRRWEGWWQDARFAARRMGRWPGTTAAIVLTFALGIGANATMFGVVDRLLLRPPAHIVEPDGVRRVVVDRFIPWTSSRQSSDVLSHLDYVHLAGARSFSAVAAFVPREVTLGEGEGASQRPAVLATEGFFPLLGVRPLIGRFWLPAEDRAGSPPVVVLGYQLWRQEFGGDPGVIGRTVDLGHGPYTVIGVAPERFTGVDLKRVDLWLPLHAVGPHLMGSGWQETHSFHAFRLLGRVAPGVAAAQAEAELTTLLRQARAEEIAQDQFDPNAAVIAAPVIGGRGPLATTEVSVAKWLAGVSLLVLVIACANVANLLLARLIRQRREIAIRLALGVSRRRLVGQALVESMMLAAAGGASAVAVAWWSGRLVRATLLPDIEWGSAPVDPRMVAIVALLVAAAGVLAGVLPAVQATRPDVMEALRAGAHQLSGRASRTRNALIVVQTTLAVVLLVGAGLFVTSLNRVYERGFGLSADGVLVVEPTFAAGVDGAARRAFFREASERIRALPAVEHAAAAYGLPFRMAMASALRVPGLDSLPRLPGGGPYFNEVEPGFFATLGLGIVDGRGFAAGDLGTGSTAVVVSETTARMLWPGRRAVGECVVVGGPEAGCSEVVGVVQDTRRFSPTEPAALQYYLPWGHDATSTPSALILRTGSDPAALIPTVQRELLAMGAGVRFVNARPLRESIDSRTRSWALGATMFTVFGILALVVAAIGLYSVLAFAVAQRTHELGIRAALGAPRERLMGMVVGQGVRLVAAGTVLGIGVALLGSGWIGPLLFETSPHDPLILASVAAALLAVGLAAAAVPGLRATRVAPSEALRGD